MATKGEGKQAEHRTRQGRQGGTRSKADEHAVITALRVAQTPGACSAAAPAANDGGHWPRGTTNEVERRERPPPATRCLLNSIFVDLDLFELDLFLFV